MKEVKERQLIKITDDLIVKRGYVERVVDEDGEIDWLMNGRPISDEHVKELLENRLNSIKKKKILEMKDGLIWDLKSREWQWLK